MTSDAFVFPVIRPLVARHAQDAAFYWSQTDTLVHSPQVTLARLAHFQRLLACHLGGLRSAGAPGWDEAFKALERWRQAGEAFVCTALALESGDPGQSAQLLAAVAEQPAQLLRGVISALVAAPDEVARATIRRWSAGDAGAAATVAALRALALLPARGGTAALALPLADYLASPGAPVRAAAARVAAACGADADAALALAMSDPALAVRAEAAIALGRGHPGAIATLAACVAQQGQVLAQATGWDSKQAARRLGRYVRQLACMLAPGDPQVPALLAALPARQAVQFILWHGDGAWLPALVEPMTDPEVQRYAGWAWQTLSGIDLEASALALPEDEAGALDQDERITEARLDADNGLVLPDAEGARAVMANLPLTAWSGQATLMGRVLSLTHALALLEAAPQAVRALAASWLNRNADLGGARLDVRASAALQRQAMQAVAQRARSAA